MTKNSFALTIQTTQTTGEFRVGGYSVAVLASAAPVDVTSLEVTVSGKVSSSVKGRGKV